MYQKLAIVLLLLLPLTTATNYCDELVRCYGEVQEKVAECSDETVVEVGPSSDEDSECFEEINEKRTRLRELMEEKIQTKSDCILEKMAGAPKLKGRRKQAKCDSLIENPVEESPVEVEDGIAETAECRTEVTALKRRCFKLRRCCRIDKDCQLEYRVSDLHDKIKQLHLDLRQLHRQCNGEAANARRIERKNRRKQRKRNRKLKKGARKTTAVDPIEALFLF